LTTPDEPDQRTGDERLLAGCGILEAELLDDGTDTDIRPAVEARLRGDVDLT
jgi:hypothetical protein